jgi:hypothetical protein
MNPILARRLSAAGVAAAMAVAVIAANAARVAEAPISAKASGGPGPAALGEVRSQLIGLQLGQKNFDEAAARRALASVPLASEPFALLAARYLADNPRGSSGREAALLSEALRRDPRSRTARILLLRNMAAKGDLPGAFAQLDVLSRLSPGLVNQAMASLGGLINTPQRMDQALAALIGHRNLYGPFVSALVGKNHPREVIARLGQGLPADVLSQPDLRRSVVGQLVDVQEFALARSIWQRGGAAQSAGPVFSPDFADHRAAPPFNWQMLETTSGSAAFGKERGLSVVYYDRSPGRLARQIVTLAPGRYLLSVDFALVSGSAANVRLQISCFGASQLLAELPLFTPKPGRSKAAVSFEVPAQACIGQELSIAGVSTEQQSETEVDLQRIDITRSAAS